MAVEAVSDELVSARNSLVSGNFAGNARPSTARSRDNLEKSDNFMKTERSTQGI
jgi:hypothetical protein